MDSLGNKLLAEPQSKRCCGNPEDRPSLHRAWWLGVLQLKWMEFFKANYFSLVQLLDIAETASLEWLKLLATPNKACCQVTGIDTGCFQHQYTNFGHTNLDQSFHTKSTASIAKSLCQDRGPPAFYTYLVFFLIFSSSAVK